MSNEEIILGWKNRQEGEGNALLPPHPSGLVELTDEALDELIAGNMAMDSCCWSSCNTKPD